MKNKINKLLLEGNTQKALELASPDKTPKSFHFKLQI